MSGKQVTRSPTVLGRRVTSEQVTRSLTVLGRPVTSEQVLLGQHFVQREGLSLAHRFWGKNVLTKENEI